MAFGENVGTARLALGFLPLFLSYGFGQALTDCFQTDTDSLSAPYRPLVRGTISRGQVLAVSLGGLAS
ncbi:MAG: penicillin-binding protein 2, partial [Candidatus Aminicenantes bacterium]|nr:penicillin-binding protein 2 [Candidatus Aminicenantes bacterium]